MYSVLCKNKDTVHGNIYLKKLSNPLIYPNIEEVMVRLFYSDLLLERNK